MYFWWGGKWGQHAKGYLKYWIFLSADLFSRYLDLEKIFERNPLWNTPETIPWDLQLNGDVHQSQINHVQIASDLPKDHPLKFLESNALRMVKFYCRLLDRKCWGCIPTDKRIFQDINSVPVSMQPFLNSKETLIEDMNNRGRQWVRKGEHSKKRGGKRTKVRRTMTILANNTTTVSQAHAEQHKDHWVTKKMLLLEQVVCADTSATINTADTNIPVAKIICSRTSM